VKEGFASGTRSCPGADASQYTAPIYTYPHSQGQAVVGGAIYRRPAPTANRFPAEYEGDIFFSDFYSPWVRRLGGSGSSWSIESAPGQPNATDWASGPTSVSDWLEAPDGSLTYCLMLTGGTGPGAIRRIRYVQSTSVPTAASRVALRAPYPVPARASVSFDYTLPIDASVAIAIYDLAGREVRALSRPGLQTQGAHHLAWDTRDNAGASVEPGVYFAQVSLDGVIHKRRLVVVR
jgi:hypothetical protein